MIISIADRVAAVITDLFGLPAAALTPDVTLQDGLQLDSLSIVELQVALEDTFDIDLAPGSAALDADLDTDRTQTYGDIVHLVQAAVQRQRQAS
jgi:acyl carrier protein